MRRTKHLPLNEPANLIRRYKLALLLGLLALAPLAACSDDDDDGVASVDDAETPAAADEEAEDPDVFEQALAYSECMRDNGIDNFPDPVEDEGGGVSMGMDKDLGIDPESEEFQAAETACVDLMPGPGEGEEIPAEDFEALVEYAECMRENGVSGFPDPEPGGGIRIDPSEIGMSPEDEEWQAAEEACKDLAPGDGEGPQGNSEDE